MEYALGTSVALERRFEEYVCELGAVVGNDARRRGLGDYVGGLLLPGGRKSMEPIAERLGPGNGSGRARAIQHFVSEAAWSDGAVRERVRAQVIPALRARAPIEHLIVDDTTLLKSGRHSVGSTAAASMPPPTARPWSACRCPTATTACRWPATSTCPRAGRTIANTPACPRWCASGPNPRSRSTSCAGR